jgi:hypothetical protein
VAVEEPLEEEEALALQIQVVVVLEVMPVGEMEAAVLVSLSFVIGINKCRRLD